MDIGFKEIALTTVSAVALVCTLCVAVGNRNIALAYYEKAQASYSNSKVVSEKRDKVLSQVTHLVDKYVDHEAAEYRNFKGEKKYLQVEDKTGNTSEGFNLRYIDYAPATKIPLTAKELKCLVGKVVQEDTQKRVALVLEYNEDYGVKIGDSWFSAEELLWGVSFLDGKPVATLQHYDEEEGEWVK